MIWQDILRGLPTTLSEIKAEIVNLESQQITAMEALEILEDDLDRAHRSLLAGDIKAPAVAAIKKRFDAASTHVDTLNSIISELERMVPAVVKAEMEAEIKEIDATLKKHQSTREEMIDQMMDHFSKAGICFQHLTGQLPQDLSYRYFVGFEPLPARYREALKRNFTKGNGNPLAHEIRELILKQKGIREKLAAI